MALKLKTGRKEFWIKRCKDRDKPESKKNPVEAEYKVIALTRTEMRDSFLDAEEEFFYKDPSAKKNSNSVRDTRTDPVKFTISRAKKCIKGWKGLTTEDSNGNEIELPFSLDMIETLYDFEPDEIEWVLMKAEEIAETISLSEEEEIKN